MKMIRLLLIITILITAFIASPIYANPNRPVARYLKEPIVKWEGHRLMGELKDAPVKNLLEELLRKDGFEWEITGNLTEKIDISFNHSTAEECILKIMRLNKFNYALIQDSTEPSDSNTPHRIKELIIYKKGDIIWFSRTQRPIPVQQDLKTAKKPASNDKRAAVSAPGVRSKPARPREARITKKSEVGPQEIPKEIREFMDELLAENKISTEEYKDVMNEMSQRKN